MFASNLGATVSPPIRVTIAFAGGIVPPRVDQTDESMCRQLVCIEVRRLPR